jgi:hypothetical protein
MMYEKSNPKPIKIMVEQLKTEGIIALLASTLAFSPSAFALNNTITNPVSNTSGSSANVGQSFINDPTPPTGTTINLNTWTFGFADVGSQTAAQGTTLRILLGTGNGGMMVSGGMSNTTSTTTFGSPSTFAVTWTFAGGLQIIDNQTYTAVLAPNLNYRLDTSGGGAYSNGVVTVGTTPFPTQDLVFRGTFSVPVPFEFSPALGLGAFGGLFALKQLVKKKAS